jgi:hypothetical protein
MLFRPRCFSIMFRVYKMIHYILHKQLHYTDLLFILLINILNKKTFKRMPSSGRRVDLVWTDVSEEHIASIFRLEKSANEEPAWAGGCRLHRIVLRSSVWQFLDCWDGGRLLWGAFHTIGDCHFNSYRSETLISHIAWCLIPNLKLQYHKKPNETAYVVQNKWTLDTTAINTVCLSRTSNLVCHPASLFFCSAVSYFGRFWVGISNGLRYFKFPLPLPPPFCLSFLAGLLGIYVNGALK